MKQAKHIIYSLILLFLISLFGFLYFQICRQNDCEVITVIFRTLMTGSVVGLITGIISYLSTKTRILQDFSNDLLKTHTEFYNFNIVMENSATRIKKRGMFFNTEELSIWLQTLNSAASHTQNTFIVPYKFSPFINSKKNRQIINYMSEYIKADRVLWNDVDRTKFQMMAAKMALEEDYKANAAIKNKEDSDKYDSFHMENVAVVSNLIGKLKKTGVSAEKLKNISLNINAYLDVNTSISPILEMEESERENYKSLIEKAKEEQKKSKVKIK